MNRLLLALLAAATAIGAGAQNDLGGTRLAESQRLAVYRYLLSHTKSARRPFAKISVNSETSKVMFSQLRKLEPKLERYDANKPPPQFASIEIQWAESLGGGVKLIRTSFSSVPDAEKPQREIEFFLLGRRTKTGWHLRAARTAPLSDEATAAGVEELAKSFKGTTLFAQASPACLQILKSRGLSVTAYPEKGIKDENAYASTGFAAVLQGEVAWLSPTRAFAFFTVLDRHARGDITYLHAGPVILSPGANHWTANVLDGEWHGE